MQLRVELKTSLSSLTTFPFTIKQSAADLKKLNTHPSSEDLGCNP